MKKNKWFIIFIIVFIIIAVSFFAYKKVEKKKAVSENYRSAEVKKDNLEVTITATGVIKATTQIDIKSEIGGKVIELPCKEGDTVKSGELIAVIDNTQQKEEYTQADADYRNILAQLEQARSSLSLQQSVSDLGIATKQEELRKAELDYKKALEELEEQKELSSSAVEQARLKVVLAEKELEKDLAGSREQEISEQLETVRQAEVTLENAKREYERQKELYEKDFVAYKDLDDAEKAYLVAKSQYQSAKDQYDMVLEGTRQEDIAIAKVQLEQARKDLDYALTQAEQNIASKERDLKITLNALDQARLALQQEIANSIQVSIKEDDVLSTQAQLDKAEASRSQARDELSKTNIMSPTNGIIIKRDVEIGDVVASQTMSSAAGTTLMTIADLSELYAVADIDESDLGKLKKKLEVTITAPAYQDLSIPGVITYIASQAEQVEQIPTFMIKIKILLDKIAKEDLPAGRGRYELLYPGMSVDADIHVEKKKDVLQLPIEAVWQKDGKSYVTLVNGDKFEDREVSTGIRNNIMIEITKGLKEGDKIKIPEMESDDDKDSN